MTPSANSHIHKEDFPTCFDTALKVADIVCLFPHSLRPFFLLFMDPLLVGLLSQDPPLVARPSWDAPLVPHLYTGSTSGSSFSWDAPLVPHLYTGSTSGGSFSMGCTSGAPSLHGIHLWWLFLHRLYFWYRIFIGFTHGGSYFMGSLVVACQDSDVHSWSLFPYPG